MFLENVYRLQTYTQKNRIRFLKEAPHCSYQIGRDERFSNLIGRSDLMTSSSDWSIAVQI